ncbi:uncharacterized protein ACA1_057220 [Acanthamoeba castellanii str. Neff]|uniref:Uncharacterized protein n=1 Tax=Acanthamoeba castellanii (strain ATCC 30010 / Neff) TaxID=1257118 RepID=L8GV85_ACACF|nr:uncharacterized protein ACA1_057220 [Acanthamoeba castellanii str. Neff]ELR17089.1 hypothetical protein ACA1_057220 [Acanthamoeba castellanii str. Neff]
MRRKPRTLAWLESEGATAGDRLLALRRWIVSKLRPVMAPPAAVARVFEEPKEDKEEDERSGAKQRVGGKKRNRERFLGWRLQVAALRLTSALVVLCTNAHAHLLLDEPGPHRKTRKAAKQRLSSESDLPLLAVVHRVLINHAADSQQWAGEASDGPASHLRREAMRTLAVVSMVLEDTRLGLETCDRLARLYLVEWPEPATVDRRLWDTADGSESNSDSVDNRDEESDDTGNQSDDDDNESDGNIDDGEEEDYVEDENEDEDEDEDHDDDDDDDDDDDKEGDEDEVGGRDAAPWRGTRHRFTATANAERAEALSTIAFLLSLVDADEQVLAFIARHKETLISTLCAKSEREHMAGPSTHFPLSIPL